MESFLLNPHLIPFKISIFIGALFIGIVPFNYMRRTGLPITNLTGLANYSKNEWKVLFIGMLLLLIGMIGSSALKGKYGFNVKVTGINGVVHIDNTKTW